MKDKHVFITGANRGIGLKLTECFLENKSVVTATARDLAHSNDLLALKEKHPEKLHLFEMDVCHNASVEQTFRSLPMNYLDVLINNAGIYRNHVTNLDKVNLDEVREAFDTNTIGAMRVTQAADKLMRSSKQPIVVQVTSKMGSIADNSSGGSYAYRISKTAMNMFHKTLSIDWPHAICIAMHPGWVKTDMGGHHAPTTSTESAQGIYQVIAKLEQKDSGAFLDFRGNAIPW